MRHHKAMSVLDELEDTLARLKQANKDTKEKARLVFQNGHAIISIGPRAVRKQRRDCNASASNK